MMRGLDVLVAARKRTRAVLGHGGGHHGGHHHHHGGGGWGAPPWWWWGRTWLYDEPYYLDEDVDIDELVGEALGDAGTGGAPSLPIEQYGPSAGGIYTDAGTIRAVQQALLAKGLSVGKGGADGKWGVDTEAARYKFGGVHGPPDDAMLARLGVAPGGVGAKAAVTRDVANLSSSLARGAPSPVPSPAPGAAPAGSSILTKPLWPGAPVRVWQAGVGALGFLLLVTGLAAAVRR